MQGCSGGHPASDIAYWLAISHERIPIPALLASYPGGSELVERDKTLSRIAVRENLPISFQ
jgi:hypothetical protein